MFQPQAALTISAMISLSARADDIDFVPHAIVGKPIEFFEDRLGRFERACDDLDFYQGLSLLLDDKVSFALRHYDGHTPGTVTVYLDGRVRDGFHISAIVQRILREIGADDAVLWQK